MKTDVVFQSKNKETEENTLNFFVQSMYFSIFWYLLEEKFDFVKSIQNSYLQQDILLYNSWSITTDNVIVGLSNYMQSTT